MAYMLPILKRIEIMDNNVVKLIQFWMRWHIYLNATVPIRSIFWNITFMQSYQDNWKFFEWSYTDWSLIFNLLDFSRIQQIFMGSACGRAPCSFVLNT